MQGLLGKVAPNARTRTTNVGTLTGLPQVTSTFQHAELEIFMIGH